MLMLRALAGMALGPSLLAASLSGAAPATVSILRPLMAVMAETGPRRAQVAVCFDHAGKVAASTLVRSSGSDATDAAAKEAALQLASLEPADASAGRTRVFSIAFAGRP